MDLIWIGIWWDSSAAQLTEDEALERVRKILKAQAGRHTGIFELHSKSSGSLVGNLEIGKGLPLPWEYTDGLVHVGAESF